MQIYLIRHKATGRSYVGQTIWDFNSRYKAGNWIGVTSNRHLKAAGRKYGKDAFEIIILWEGQCSRDELDKLEQKFMEEHKALHPHGYNDKEAGYRGTHHCYYREYELIDASGTIYQVANLRQFCGRRGLSYTAMLNMVSGRNLSSYGFALSSTPISQIIDPEQTWTIEHVVTGEHKTVKRKEVKTTFRELGMTNVSDLLNLLAERTKVSKGWKLPTTVLTPSQIETEHRFHNGVELVHENGERIIVKNVFQFCEERGIYRNSMYDVINGKAVTCHGWRLASLTNPRAAFLEKLGLKINLTNIQTGETVLVKNVSEWSRQKGLILGSVHNMISGRIPQYANWTVTGRDLTSYQPRRLTTSILMKHTDGREILGQTAKQIARDYGICSGPSISDIINGQSRNLVKGWSVIHVKFKHDYYPEMNLEPFRE